MLSNHLQFKPIQFKPMHKSVNPEPGRKILSAIAKLHPKTEKMLRYSGLKHGSIAAQIVAWRGEHIPESKFLPEMLSAMKKEDVPDFFRYGTLLLHSGSFEKIERIFGAPAFQGRCVWEWGCRSIGRFTHAAELYFSKAEELYSTLPPLACASRAALGDTENQAGRELARIYAQTKDPLVRELALEHYAPWARRVAIGAKSKFPEHIVTMDDAVQCGLDALSRCLERYSNPEVAISAYAFVRVVGAVTDAAMQKKKEGRKVQVKDLSDDPANTFTGQFSAWGEEQKTPFEAIDCSYRAKKLKSALRELLPWEHESMLDMLYSAGFSMKEIGKFLGVSESRISYLHKEVISKLRQNLNPKDF